MTEATEGSIRLTIRKIDEVLLIGTTPKTHLSVETKESPEDKLFAVWDHIVDECLKNMPLSERAMEVFNMDTADAAWRLVVTLTDSLSQLLASVITLEGIPREDHGVELLSIQTQALLQKALAIIGNMGIMYNLPRNIGFREESDNKAFDIMDIGSSSPTDLDKFLRLSYILQEMNDMCCHELFSRQILGPSLLQYLSAAIFICYSKISPPTTNTTKIGALTPENYIIVISTQTRLRKVFETEIKKLIPLPKLFQATFPLSQSPKPKWCISKCRELALDIFKGPDGLVIATQVLLDMFSKNQLPLVTNVIRKLIADYFQQLTPGTKKVIAVSLSNQANSLIHSGCKGERELLMRQVGVNVGLVLLDHAPCISHKIIFDPIFNDVYSILDKCGCLPTMEQINFCVFVAETILAYREDGEGVQKHVLEFTRLWAALFNILAALEKELEKSVQILAVSEVISPLKTKIEQVLIQYLDILNSDSVGTCKVLDAVSAFLIPQDSKSLRTHPVRLKVSMNSSGEVKLERDEFQDMLAAFFEIATENVAVLFHKIILREGSDRRVYSSLFSQLVNQEQTGSSKEKMHVQEDSTELDLQDLTNEADVRKFVSIILMAELGNRSSNTGETVVMEEGKSGKEALMLVLPVFHRLIHDLEESTANPDNFVFMTSLSYVINVIFVITEEIMRRESGAKLKNVSEESETLTWIDLDPFAPLLLKIISSGGQISNLSPLRVAAELSYNRILMRGSGESVETESKYKKAMACVANEAPHIKGHGLIELRKYIIERDGETLENADEIIDTLIRELEHEDSYVYLSAISALSLLGSVNPKRAIPLLLKQFEEGRSHGSEEERLQSRLKMGETIVGVIKRVGAYGESLRFSVLDTISRTLQDPEWLIRSAALSMLSDLLGVLKYSLGDVLTKVWGAIEYNIKFDKQDEVRRAGFHVIYSALKNLRDSFTNDYLLSDSELGAHLRDVGRMLKSRREIEQDSVCLVHIDMCLEEISGIVSRLFQVKDDLEYRLRILSSD